MSPIFNLCHHSACSPSAEFIFKLRKSCNKSSGVGVGVGSNVAVKEVPSHGSLEKSVSCRSSALKGKTFRLSEFSNSVWLAKEAVGGFRIEWDRPRELLVVAEESGKRDTGRVGGGAESVKPSKGWSGSKRVKSQRKDSQESSLTASKAVKKFIKAQGKDLSESSKPTKSFTKIIKRVGSGKREVTLSSKDSVQQRDSLKTSRNLDLAKKALYTNDATLARVFKGRVSEENVQLTSGTGRILADSLQTKNNSRFETLCKAGEDEEENSSEMARIEVSGSRNVSGTVRRLEADRIVDVEVEVVSWRERHIKANVCVEASDQMVWNVLTDYERLAEFIPNLARSERIRSPQPGRVWLLQQGVQSSMYWHIEARVVLDLEELPLEPDGKELRFSMVDGDFKRYEGRWYLRPGPRPGTTMLFYEVSVTPKLFFPAPFVERIIRADLPVNLSALAQRAESDPSDWQRSVPLPKPKLKPTPSPIRSFLNKLSSPNFVQRFPVESIKTALQFPSLIERVGVDAVQRSLLNSKEDETSTWNTREPRWGASSRACTMERPCSVDEVHLRRLDDLLENGGVHRRVVAAITVESPIKDVWTVLTDYECLSEFVPNLASSKIISRENNRVRLLQEGCKCILYMVLHARVVLDLWEKPEHEILFQQVEGDFASFQGKWTLEALGSQHTLLKYVVDTKMHKHCLLAEAIVEEVIYEDLPANLCAIRDRVEHLKLKTPSTQTVSPPERSTGSDDSGENEKPTRQQPKPVPKGGNKRFRVAGLQKDFKILERELLAFIEENGKEGVMPMRSELRLQKRVDLEKAITRMGGFSTVASKLNLCQQRRPRGYWDNFQNVRNEIMQLQKECGMDLNYLPTRNALNNAGRPDVARALEKWGGAQEVARLLGLKVRRVRYRSPRKSKFLEASNIENDEFICQKPFKISLPEKPRKWVDMKEKVRYIDKAES
ncbi:hypothetical protein Mapa_000165 [Marchantia paleacea]|nr:hypothetical protein Mapa_000165 [Marchantia paleacea]